MPSTDGRRAAGDGQAGWDRYMLISFFSRELRKEDKVWPAQAVKIEPVVTARPCAPAAAISRVRTSHNRCDRRDSRQV